MTVALTWLGHATWLIESNEHRILLDPFLTDNPSAQVAAKDLNPTCILVSHGHFDHTNDLVTIAKRTSAPVYAIFEIAQWLGKQGVESATGMNIGGRVKTAFGSVKLTPAVHSSCLPDGTYGGSPAGFVVEIESKKIYFACDTALFSDMQLIGKAGLDLAVIPIGDLYTMGIEDSIEAVKLIGPKKVAPTHYNTWPPIEQDAEAWAQLVRTNTSAEPITPAVGKSFSL